MAVRVASDRGNRAVCRGGVRGYGGGRGWIDGGSRAYALQPRQNQGRGLRREGRDDARAQVRHGGGSQDGRGHNPRHGRSTRYGWVGQARGVSRLRRSVPPPPSGRRPLEMAFSVSQGCRIYYRLEGHPDKPLLVLVHALGTDHGLWDQQMPALLRHFQGLRPDLRGHGASDAPPGDYTIAQLAEDILSTVPRERFLYCGLSLGGMIGQWLAARYPARIERMVLANTSARVTDPGMFEPRRKTGPTPRI